MFSILGQNWEVKFTREPIGGDMASRAFLGSGNIATNKIFIDGTMPQTRQEEVLTHEIIHQVTSGWPEMMVEEVGVGLYAAFKQNGLIPDDYLTRFSDGDATPEEMRQLNEESKALMEDPSPMFFKVSEKGWEGDVFQGDGLTVTDSDGKVNRTAVHKAAALLTSGYNLVKNERRVAKEVSNLYKDVLLEPVPRRIKELSR